MDEPRRREVIAGKGLTRLGEMRARVSEPVTEGLPREELKQLRR